MQTAAGRSRLDGMADPDASRFAVPLEELERRSRIPAELQVVGVPVSAAAAYLALGLVPFYADGAGGGGDGD